MKVIIACRLTDRAFGLANSRGAGVIRRLTSSSVHSAGPRGPAGGYAGSPTRAPHTDQRRDLGSASAWPDFAADLCKADRRRIGRPARAGLLRERRRLRRKPLAKFGRSIFLTWGRGMRGSRLRRRVRLGVYRGRLHGRTGLQKPVFRLPTGFLGPSDQSVERSGPAPADLPQWWRSLRDRQLDSLEDRALAANLDLGNRRRTRFQEARAALGGDRQSGASGGRSDVRRRLRDGKQRDDRGRPAAAPRRGEHY